MADGKILRSDILDEDVIKGLKDVSKEIIEISKNFQSVITESQKFKENLKGINDMKSFNKMMNENAQNIKNYNKQVNALQKAQQAAADSLNRQRQKALQDELKLQEKLERARVSAAVTKPGTENRLIAVNRVLMLQMKQLNPLIAQERQQLAQLQMQYNANAEAIRKYSGGMNSAKGAFGNLVGSIKNLVASYVSLYAVVGLVRKIFSDTRELDKLNLTYKSVIKNSQELAQTQEWLGDISQRFGLDLLNLSERYVKFRAATLSSKITVQDTQRVFESFSKASAILGLRTDEVGGVFLALEQMMSKGKVTTEELRRQLGERLPGAFQIMAKALDVSTRELDKMLKSGEILSEEVLPKFAKTMEEVYGIQNVTRIDTLAAAQGRFNKAWLDFVKSLEASGTFKEAFNVLTDILNITTEKTRTYIENIRLQNDEFDRFMSIIDDVNTAELETVEVKAMVISQINKESLSWRKSEKAYAEYIAKRKKAEEASLKQEQQLTEIRKKNANELEIELSKLTDESELISSRQEEYILRIAKGWKISKPIYEAEIAKLEERKQTILDTITLLERVQKEQQTDPEKYKAELESIKEAYETYGKLASLETKNEFLISNKEFRIALASKSKDYKAYLEDQLRSAKLSASERMIAELELANITSEKKTGGGTKPKDDAIDKEKKRQEALVEEVKSNQEKALAERIKTEQLTSDEISTIRERNSLVILYMEQDHIRQLVEMTKAGTEERLSLEADLKEKTAEINKSKTDIAIDEMKRQMDEEKRIAKERLDLRKDENKNAELTIDEWIASQILARQKLATEDIKANKNSAEKVAEIQSAAELDIMRILERGALLKANLYEDDTIEYRKWMLEKERISEDTEKSIQDNQKKTAKLSQEQIGAMISFMGESVNTGFEVIKSFSQSNTATAEQTYEREMILAGNNMKMQEDAMLRLHNTKKKIARKEAALDKAQAIFNIGLSTAQAIIGIWAQVPKYDFGISATALTAIVASLGAAQIAAVLAQQVPAYEKGGITEGGMALVSEKGSEMAILPSGKQIITPETPTLMGFPKGTEIIPHEETARLLAESARNNFIRETIDLSMTNNYLRSIRDKESVTIVDGYKYVNKNGIRGRYALGV